MQLKSKFEGSSGVKCWLAWRLVRWLIGWCFGWYQGVWRELLLWLLTDGNESCVLYIYYSLYHSRQCYESMDISMVKTHVVLGQYLMLSIIEIFI